MSLSGFLTVIGIVLCGPACAPAIGQDPPESACHPAAPESVEPRLEYLRELISATDSASIADREAFELQWAAAGEVRWVTKASVCTAAVAAVNRVAGTPGRARRVWVYSMGQAYAVEDPSLGWTEPLGSAYPVYLFDRKWRSKPVLMM
ncbi:MAG TPA: hypothetical protein VFH67_04370 [bacterium]|nr:hypothetical protein [bacterium]